ILALQFQPGAGLYGRLRQYVPRFPDRSDGARRLDADCVQYDPGDGGAGGSPGDPDLRYDAGHGRAPVERAAGVARRARPLVTPARSIGTLGARDGGAALRYEQSLRAPGAALLPNPAGSGAGARRADVSRAGGVWLVPRNGSSL